MKKQKIIIALLIIAVIGLFSFAWNDNSNQVNASPVVTVEIVSEQNGCTLYFTHCHGHYTFWSVCRGSNGATSSVSTGM